MSDAKCVGPFRVANPEGIVPETKIDAFVKRLRDDPQLPATFEIWTHPGEGIHYLSHRHRTIGTIAGDVLSLSTNCDRFIGAWLRETWRSLNVGAVSEWTTWRSSDAAPEVPSRVQRFLDTLTMSGFTCRTGHGELVRGPFTAKFYPKEGSIEITGNGVQFGLIRSDRLTAYNQIVGEDAANSLEHIWRELDRTPPVNQRQDTSAEMEPRIHRFLAALTDHEIDFKDDYGYTVKAPFTTAVLPLQNVIIVLGNGVEFGEVRGDDFTPDTAMPCDIRAILRHVWREVIREEALLNRIATLEAECAEKTRRLDQIAAIIKGDK